MQIRPLDNSYVNYNNYGSNRQLAFTGSPVQPVETVVAKSKLFDPLRKGYDKVTDWIAHNYYERFYHSKFAEWFVDKTKNVKNMTTHMSALGATLISGMYITRTLQNDKLDPQKRKTLALNDFMTWGISTTCSYFLDSKLANWWERVTTRFAANYLDIHPEAKNVEHLGEWEAKNLPDVMKNWHVMRNKQVDKLKAMGNNVVEHIKPEEAIPYKNIRDFNLDILKNPKLTTLIDGMGVLKTLFVFGMVYRYIVPVLVMKPANKIGAYIHNKNAEKNQQKA